MRRNYFRFEHYPRCISLKDSGPFHIHAWNVCSCPRSDSLFPAAGAYSEAEKEEKRIRVQEQLLVLLTGLTDHKEDVVRRFFRELNAIKEVLLNDAGFKSIKQVDFKGNNDVFLGVQTPEHKQFSL